MLRTVHSGSLVVQSAYPDPPFEIMANGAATGFDIELMRAICRRLGLELRPVAFLGDDFNDIFDGLIRGTCDAVISGTTITPERAASVRFSKPYLAFNQGIAVNTRVMPHVAALSDLRGLTAGIQKGNTSNIVARLWPMVTSPPYATTLITASCRRSTTSRPDASALSSSSGR